MDEISFESKDDILWSESTGITFATRISVKMHQVTRYGGGGRGGGGGQAHYVR